MKVTTALTNAIIVTAHNRFEGSLGISGGKIACLAGRQTAIDADEFIDVEGKYIIPVAVITCSSNGYTRRNGVA